MTILMICDSQTTAALLRQIMMRQRCECPPENQVSVSHARRALKSLGAPPQLILFVLPEQREPALKQLQLLRERTDTYLAVVGPACDPDVILESIHAGADDFLDTETDLQPQLKRCLQSALDLPGRQHSQEQHFSESRQDVKFLNVFRNSLNRSYQ